MTQKTKRALAPYLILAVIVLLAVGDWLRWSTDIAWLPQSCTGWRQMKPWVSLWIMCLGLAAMLQVTPLSAWRRWVSRSLAGLVGATSLFVLAEYVLRLGTGFDLLLFGDRVAALACTAGGRPPFEATLAAILSAAAIGVVRITGVLARRIWVITGAISTLLAAVEVLRYTAEDSGFSVGAGEPAISLTAAVLFLALIAVVAFMRDDVSPRAWFLAHPGRAHLGRIILVVVVFPIILLLVGSLLHTLGIEEQLSETLSIALGTLSLALILNSFSRRMQSQLEISETHYRLLAENSADIIVRFSPDLLMEWVSPSVTRMLGWLPDELMRQSAAGLVHPDDAERAMAGRRTLLETGRSSYRTRVRCKDGTYRWIGVRAQAFFNKDGSVQGISSAWRDIQAEMEAEQKLDRLARVDGLTGLLNRAEIYQRIAERIDVDGSSPAAILFCDLDNLKQLNDEAGHALGDAVLQAVARRIAAAVRAGDLVARIGGDEFLVMLRNVDSADEAVLLAERIRAAVAQPVDVDGSSYYTSLSIGVVMASAGESVEETVTRADHAMYAAKSAGRNRVAVGASPQQS